MRNYLIILLPIFLSSCAYGSLCEAKSSCNDWASEGGNDTGFMHISAALNLNTVALFMDSPVLAYGKYSKNINVIVYQKIFVDIHKIFFKLRG